MEEEEIVRRHWGSDEAYYKELERFHEQHKDAHNLVVDTATGIPVKVEYYFLPWQVVVEHEQLMQKIAEANRERVDAAD